jgi:hypothetical protein
VNFNGVSTIWAGQSGQIVVWDVKKRVMQRALECEGDVHCAAQVGIDSAWVGAALHLNGGCLIERKLQ